MKVTNLNKIQCSIQNYKNHFKLMTYNIDQAVREEEHAKTKWEVRKNRIKALIQEVNADIVCLQELRQLYEDSDPPEVFLGELSRLGYESFLVRRNPSRMAFGNAILWKSSRFIATHRDTMWLSDTPWEVSVTESWSPNTWGATVSGVFLQSVHERRVIDNVPGFWVWNTHFLLEEKFKFRACEFLVSYFGGDRRTRNSPWILCGDFNFFMPLPNSSEKVFGDEQRKVLTDGGFQDLSKNAQTLGGKTIDGTFFGYDHDPFKSNLSEMHSRLDHVFGSTYISVHSAIQYTRSMSDDITFEDDVANELTHRNYPSDHLPQVLELEVH